MRRLFDLTIYVDCPEGLRLQRRLGRDTARRGREAGTIVMGAVLMFLLAGLVEGIFRQTVHSVPVRLVVAVASALAWVLYFRERGREARR